MGTRSSLGPGLDRRLDPAYAELSRRRFLTVTGAAAALALSGTLPGLRETLGGADPRRRVGPFTLGIASGDPLPDGVVLWTRLAPDPLAPHGGLGQRAYPVEWQLATDERFRHVVRSGTATARPETGHSVHVDVRGLEPWRDYFYRFRSGGVVSDAGRTRTAPAPDQLVPELRLAFASCQARWEGWYTAYRDLCAREHDVVLFLGDYIYEYGAARSVRPDDGLEQNIRPAMSLEDYRQRYALYKLDADLQAAHRVAPWVVVWDDHEVADNWAGDDDGPTSLPRADFLQRRANAFRAYWENMPLRTPQRPTGGRMTLHRRLRYGRLAELHMLDTRQFRDDQVNFDGRTTPGPATDDPRRSILGAEQERWLVDGLTSSTAVWNVLGHQTAITRLDARPGEKVGVPGDTWDGYAASRDRLLRTVHERRVPNVVSLAGDLHRSIASDLVLDFDDPAATPVATELVGTSISSGRDGSDLDLGGWVMLEENPHQRFGNAQRGYVSCTVTPSEWRADFRVCDQVTTPGGSVSSRVVLGIEAGRPGVQAV